MIFKKENTFKYKETSINLWNGQSLCFFRSIFRVRARVRVCGDARSVKRLEVDLGAEEVTDSLQRAAGVGGQRGVCQQV